jgi:hypothetical protein
MVALANGSAKYVALTVALVTLTRTLMLSVEGYLWIGASLSSVQKQKYTMINSLDGMVNYLIIAGHFSDYIWGLAAYGKAPPLTWFNRWFAQYAPTSDKCCY